MYSNYPLYGIPYIFLKGVNHFDVCRDGFVLADEIWLIADSRLSLTTKNRFVANILSRSRKRGLNICMLPDEKIICNPDINSISKIPIGINVFTYLGNFKPVINTYENDYNGSVFTFTSKKIRYDTTLTSEHLIYVAIPIIETVIPKENLRKKWSPKEEKQLILNKIFGRNLNYDLPDKTRRSCTAKLGRVLKYTKIRFKYSWIGAGSIDKDYFLLAYPIISGTVDRKYEDLMDYSDFDSSKNVIKEILGEKTLTRKVIEEYENNGKNDIEDILKNNNVDTKMRYYIKQRIKSGYKSRYEMDDDFITDKSSKNKVKRRIEIDNDFCYLTGIYLSDGGITGRGIDIALGKNQMKEAEKVRDVLKRKFNLNVKVEKKHNYLLLRICSKVVMDFFLKLFGKGAGKKLPNWFLFLPREKQMEFVNGYVDGDGNRSERGFISIVTAVQTISFQIMQILLRNNFIPEIYPYKSGCYKTDKVYHWIKYSTNKKSRIGIIDKNYLLLPIKKIREKFYNGKVYNLEVEDDNSYVSTNLIAHNSFTTQLLDSLDKRIRKILDFSALPVMNTNETILRCNVFRTGYPKLSSYIKTFYFKTPLIFNLYPTNYEIEMEEECSQDPQIIFQETEKSEPQYFQDWESADDAGAKYWEKRQNDIKKIF